MPAHWLATVFTASLFGSSWEAASAMASYSPESALRTTSEFRIVSFTAANEGGSSRLLLGRKENR